MVRPFDLIPLEQWLDLPPAVVVLNFLLSNDPSIDAMLFGDVKQALMLLWSTKKAKQQEEV